MKSRAALLLGSLLVVCTPCSADSPKGQTAPIEMLGVLPPTASVPSSITQVELAQSDAALVVDPGTKRVARFMSITRPLSAPAPTIPLVHARSLELLSSLPGTALSSDNLLYTSLLKVCKKSPTDKLSKLYLYWAGNQIKYTFSSLKGPVVFSSSVEAADLPAVIQPLALDGASPLGDPVPVYLHTTRIGGPIDLGFILYLPDGPRGSEYGGLTYPDAVYRGEISIPALPSSTLFNDAPCIGITAGTLAVNEKAVIEQAKEYTMAGQGGALSVYSYPMERGWSVSALALYQGTTEAASYRLLDGLDLHVAPDSTTYPWTDSAEVDRMLTTWGALSSTTGQEPLFANETSGKRRYYPLLFKVKNSPAPRKARVRFHFLDLFMGSTAATSGAFSIVTQAKYQADEYAQSVSLPIYSSSTLDTPATLLPYQTTVEAWVEIPACASPGEGEVRLAIDLRFPITTLGRSAMRSGRVATSLYSMSALMGSGLLGASLEILGDSSTSTEDSPTNIVNVVPTPFVGIKRSTLR